jgi:hypothetical protein
MDKSQKTKKKQDAPLTEKRVREIVNEEIQIKLRGISRLEGLKHHSIKSGIPKGY